MQSNNRKNEVIVDMRAGAELTRLVRKVKADRLN